MRFDANVYQLLRDKVINFEVHFTGSITRSLSGIVFSYQLTCLHFHQFNNEPMRAELFMEPARFCVREIYGLERQTRMPKH